MDSPIRPVPALARQGEQAFQSLRGAVSVAPSGGLIETADTKLHCANAVGDDPRLDFAC